jgi:hypothetical protein
MKSDHVRVLVEHGFRQQPQFQAPTLSVSVQARPPSPKPPGPAKGPMTGMDEGRTRAIKG